jgi:hypothetical protein
MVPLVEEEAGVSGSHKQSVASTVVVATEKVESGGDLESGRDLGSFGMKSEMMWGGLLFIGSKISAAVLI